MPIMVLSAEWLKQLGYSLVIKENGDVIIESPEANCEFATKLREDFEQAYPEVNSDILCGIAYNAVKTANAQQLVFRVSNTPSNLERAAYDANVEGAY
ncbi:hypothetical protein LCGC14_1352510 [marine sediment metagenome]|uniref:Uncharacterized protein n=1 Tax=marine sediment metagenome TaxID=412755 RepID=A0A0F9KAG0_9ZZZZ